MKNELLKVYPDLAARLGVSRNRAYELVASGEIPSIRLSERSIRVPESALESWIEKKLSEVGEA